MCALGHHDHPDDVLAPGVRPRRERRRHLDGTWTRIVAAMPRKLRNEARATIHAALAAQLAGKVTQHEEPAQADFHEQFEPLPAGAEYLPDARVDYDDGDKLDRRRGRSAAFRATGEVAG